MKQSGFRKKTYAEIVELQEKARQRKLLKIKSAPPARKKKEKKPKPKKDRVRILKKKVWAAFSRYIRKKWADPVSGMVLTCDGKYIHWQETHCGHFLNNSERSQSLGGNELWYYENNFAPQSSEGNYFNADDSAKLYAVWVVRRYGEDEVQKMIYLKQQPRKYTEEEMQAKLEHYEAEFAKL